MVILALKNLRSTNRARTSRSSTDTPLKPVGMAPRFVKSIPRLYSLHQSDQCLRFSAVGGLDHLPSGLQIGSAPKLASTRNKNAGSAREEGDQRSFRQRSRHRLMRMKAVKRAPGLARPSQHLPKSTYPSKLRQGCSAYALAGQRDSYVQGYLYRLRTEG